jgi:hypothetical protein
MNIRLTVAALAFSVLASTSFAAAPTATSPAALSKVSATSAAPAGKLATMPVKKGRCPNGQHRIAGKCTAVK